MEPRSPGVFKWRITRRGLVIANVIPLDLNGENQNEDCLQHLESKFTPEQLTTAKARLRELESQNQ